MRSKLHLLAAIAGFVPLCAACSFSSAETERVTVAPDVAVLAMQKADSALAAMTLEEIAGQLLVPSVMSSGDEATLRMVEGYMADCHVGGLILLKGETEDASKIISVAAAKSVVRPLIAIDAEWGLGMRLSDAPAYPRNNRLGNADVQLMYDYGREVARQCRLLGIGMVLGPVIDVAPDVDSFMGERSFGADARRVAELGIAYARGLESGGVMSAAKHFPGHGSAAEDSHKGLAVIEADSISFARDLYPFERYVAEHLSAVMVGHLAVRGVDSVMRSAAVSPVIIEELLRGRMAFDGLILTDALNMEGASGASAVEAIAAGADMVLSPTDTRAELMALCEAVETGRLPLHELLSHARRVLFYKYLKSDSAEYKDVGDPFSASAMQSLSRRLEEVAAGYSR